MNDNYNNGNNTQNDSENEKERIRFDDADFNPYSRYYSGNDRQNEFREEPYNKGKNPYSGHYTEKKEESFYSELADGSGTREHFSRIGLGYALFSVITFAVTLIIATVVRLVNPEFYNSNLFLNLLTPLALYVFALPVLLIVLSRCEAKAPQKRRMGFGEWILFLIASFGFMYIGSIIGNTVMSSLSELVGYDYSNALSSIIDDENLIITIIFAVIIAPIGEEFVFRKLIIDRTQKYGPLISIGLSGLMFGIMHSNFYQFFYCFALGIILGYMYYTTGKLHLTIAIHAVVNFVGGVIPSLFTPITDALLAADPEDPSAMLEIVMENPLTFVGLIIFELFVYAAMACAVIFLFVFRKKLKGKLLPGEVCIPRQKLIPTVILNGGVIAMFVVYLLEFGLSLLP